MSDADDAGGDGDDESVMLRLTLSCSFFFSLLLVPMMVPISSVAAVAAAAGAAETNRMSGAHGTIRHTATDSGTRRALAPTRQRRRLVRVVDAPMVKLLCS